MSALLTAFVSVFDRLTGAIGRPALSAQGALVLWGALLLFLWLMRSCVFVGAGADDGETLVHTQHWALGYDARNPPLFTWLVLLVQQITGPVVASVVLVKFALLGGAYCFLYLGARHALGDERLAALAALTPLAMYHVVWVTAFHLTHTSALAFSVTFTFYALTRLERRGDLANYAIFGAAAGVGLLAKYNYPLFAAALLIAAVSEKSLRPSVLNMRCLAALAGAAALAAPHYLWLLDWTASHRDAFAALLEKRFALNYAAEGYTSGLVGLIDAPLAVLHFLLPALVFLVLLFPRACWRAGQGPAPSERYRRLLGRALLLLVVVAIAAVGILGIPRLKIHYMFVLLLFPVYFFARVQAAGAWERSIRTYGTVLVILAALVGAAVTVKFFTDPKRSSKAHHNMPYAALAQELAKAGFQSGTILGDWFTYSVAGNLRPYFPDSRVVNLYDWRHYLDGGAAGRALIPEPDRASGQCLVVWTARDDGGREDVMRGSVAALFGATAGKEHPVRRVSAEMPPESGRFARLDFILVPGGVGTCR